LRLPTDAFSSPPRESMVKVRICEGSYQGTTSVVPLGNAQG
jgi:hypothetical protein